MTILPQLTTSSRSPFIRQAMFGGMLFGDRAMRYIYVDEAGTSASEPVTIVVGLIVDADKQVVLAEGAIDEILGGVPASLRSGFVFHATQLWNDKSYRDEWSLAHRLYVLKAMMALPRKLSIPIAVGVVPRGAASGSFEFLPLLSEQRDHFLAFTMCIAAADKHLRDYGRPQEVATVVAEDVPEMQKVLRVVPKMLREAPVTLSDQHFNPSARETAQGYGDQQGEFRVSRVRNAIHFVAKPDDPLLQLADACAFGLRRHFSDLEHGAELVRTMLGFEPPLADFANSASSAVWF